MSKKKKNTEEVQEDLASILADSLNKKFKDDGHKVAYFIDTEKDNPANIKQWVSTGCDMLDLAISNRANGGLPSGKIVEIQGLEGAGKSLLAAHVMAETQKLGGVVVYIDTEHAMDETFFTAIGIDFNKFLYLPISKLEDVFGAAEEVITNVRKGNKDVPVTIVIDSIMGAKTQQEDDAEFGKDGYATQKAIIMSKAMRKMTDLISWEKVLLVCTNQLRVKMNAMFGDPYTTSGGKALGFHASVRLRIKSMGKIKGKVNGVEQIVGMKTQVQVVKNRLGPPHKVINYDIYFDSGIDNVGGWLGVLKAYKIVKTAGAWLKYTSDAGEEFSFQAKDFEEQIMSNETVKQELYDKICEKFIMSYQPRVHGESELVDLGDENAIANLAQQFDGGVTTDDIPEVPKKSVITENTDFLNESTTSE
jgi:recombination protein RecA